MSKLLEAIKALDPKGVEGCLAEDADSVRGNTSVVCSVFRSWVRKYKDGDPSPTPAYVASMVKGHRAMLMIMKTLLEGGAQPRGVSPPSVLRMLGVHDVCSSPLEAVVCYIEPPLARPILELLQEFGSRLDGVCDGSCQTAKSSGVRCCALSAALTPVFSITQMPPELRVMVDSSGYSARSIVLDRELIALLVRSGAGSVELTTMAGVMSAARYNFLFAVIHRVEQAAVALLDAGISPDFETNLPMTLPSAPVTPMHSSLPSRRQRTKRSTPGPAPTSSPRPARSD